VSSCPLCPLEEEKPVKSRDSKQTREQDKGKGGQGTSENLSKHD